MRTQKLLIVESATFQICSIIRTLRVKSNAFSSGVKHGTKIAKNYRSLHQIPKFKQHAILYTFFEFFMCEFRELAEISGHS